MKSSRNKTDWLFWGSVLLIVLGPAVARLVNPGVAQQYDRAITALAASLLYKGSVYVGFTMVFTKGILRLLGVKTWQHLRKEIVEDNSAAIAIVMIGVPLLIAFLLTQIWGG